LVSGTAEGRKKNRISFSYEHKYLSKRPIAAL
jgi:hypothetical protein